MNTYAMLVVMIGAMEPLGNSEGFGLSRATGVIVPAGEGANLPDGVTLQAPEGGALMETRVFVQDETMFESGRIEFPGINSYVDVTTRTPGKDHANSDGSGYGSASWYITGGGGEFAGSKGIVTGNFVGAADLSFVDYQFFLIQLA